MEVQTVAEASRCEAVGPCTARYALSPLVPVVLVLLTGASAAAGGTDRSVTQGAPHPRIEPVAQLRIDGQEHTLSWIQGFALRSDGLLVLSDRPVTLLLFDQEGQKVGEFRRQGAGPGEFAQIAAMGWSGDTLWVSDLAQGRLTRITGLPDSTHVHSEVRTSDFRSGSRPVRLGGRDIPAFDRVGLRAIYPGGDILASLTRPGDPGPSEFADSALLTRMSPDGTLQQLVATVPWRPGVVRVLPRHDLGAPWTFPASLIAVSSDGQRIAVIEAIVEDGRSVDTFEATMLDGSGETMYTRRHPLETVPITRAVADSAIEAKIKQVVEPNIDYYPGVDLAAAYRREVYVPPVFPPFGKVLIGTDGRLWIELRDVPGSGSRSYLVLDEQGDLEAEVMLPGGVRAAGGDWVWRVVRDELDVPSVIRYRVPWPEGRDR